MTKGGICKIYNWTSTYNIKTEWGVSLSDGAISTLLAPPAAKQRISNESRLEHGKRIDIYVPTKFDSRELTLEMHLIAPNYATFVANFKGFINALVSSPEGIILEYKIYGQRVQYHLQYLSCTQFAAYNGTLGKFAVRFVERDPSGMGAVTTQNPLINDNEN